MGIVQNANKMHFILKIYARSIAHFITFMKCISSEMYIFQVKYFNFLYLRTSVRMHSIGCFDCDKTSTVYDCYEMCIRVKKLTPAIAR